LFELFDLCKRPPYPDLGNAQVRGLLGEKHDMSLELKIDDAPNGVFQILQECLNFDSHARPTFPVIAERMAKIEQELLADGGKLNVWSQPDKQASTDTVQDSTYGEDEEKEQEYDNQSGEEE